MQPFQTTFCLSLLFVTLSASAGQESAAQVGTPKPIATGVLNVIAPELDARDSYSQPMPLPGLNAKEYTPNFAPKQDTLYGQTRNIVFFRDVWNYEFAFLGLRQFEFQGKNIWYMVYRIRNIGATLTYVQVKEDARFDHIKHDLKRNEKPIEADDFLPRFSLEGWVQKGGNYDKVVYRDGVNPTLLRVIQNREDPNRHLLNTVEMSRVKIPVARDSTESGVWGVAIWEDVDPRIDYVSVFVSGLTNAYRINRTRDGKIGFKYKTLQLNFWRPGDTREEFRDRVDYGIPLVDNSKEQVEICRRYDLPGPVMRAYRVDENANQDVLILEADGEVSLSSFKSALVPDLDGGKLASPIVRALADAGYSLPKDVTVTPIIEGFKWSFQDGDGTTFVLRLEPQFWEPNYDRTIRFIKRLDHLWIYR